MKWLIAIFLMAMAAIGLRDEHPLYSGLLAIGAIFLGVTWIYTKVQAIKGNKKSFIVAAIKCSIIVPILLIFLCFSIGNSIIATAIICLCLLGLAAYLKIRRAAKTKSVNTTNEEKETDSIFVEIQRRQNEFSTELESIQRVDIEAHPPVSKKYLKDMPEYGFSNITSRTKVENIFPLVIVDVETTGLYPSNSEIIEVSAIKFDVGMIPVSCFTALCKPKKPIPSQATAINNITDDMVKNCPHFSQIAPSLSQFISGCSLSGHNLDFDLRFLYVHGTEIPFERKMYDTLKLAQQTIKKSDIGNHKLETLCHWYGIHRPIAHRSLSDCMATAKVFAKLVFDKTSMKLENETSL